MGTFGVHFISVVSGFMWFFYMQADVEIGYLGCWSLFLLMLWYWCAKSDVCPNFFINQRNESALPSLLLFNQQPIKIPLSIIGFCNLHTGCAVMESTSLEVFILYSTRYYFKKCRAVSNVAVSAIIFMLASIYLFLQTRSGCQVIGIMNSAYNHTICYATILLHFLSRELGVASLRCKFVIDGVQWKRFVVSRAPGEYSEAILEDF